MGRAAGGRRNGVSSGQPSRQPRRPPPGPRDRGVRPGPGPTARQPGGLPDRGRRLPWPHGPVRSLDQDRAGRGR
jgi:hypothetical protein